MRYRRDLASFLNRRRLATGVVVGSGDIAGDMIPGAVAAEPVPQLAAKFEDGTLDFLIGNRRTEYAPVRDLLAAWYPKLRAGGFFGGAGFLDGLLDGKLYGVRTAVNEFAREHDLVIRLTLDKVQTWFTFKRPTTVEQPNTRILVLTACDQKQRGLAAISSPNKSAYCKLHGDEFIEKTSGFPTDRPPVWAKIALLRKHLRNDVWVFWTDTDSLIMDLHRPLSRFCDPEADMVICHEDLGIGVYNVNAGQMLFKASDWSQWFLAETWNQTWALKDAHQEQRAIIHLLWSRDLSEHVQIVAQKTFNCYPANYQRGDFLLHFPDIPNEQRAQLMRYWAQFATS